MSHLFDYSFYDAKQKMKTCKHGTMNINFNSYRIYENGVDIDISKLYPEIEFPVSRGTPMISSLIKWDYTEDYFVMKYERKVPVGEKGYSLTIADDEHEYICGHKIDGILINL